MITAIIVICIIVVIGTVCNSVRQYNAQDNIKKISDAVSNTQHKDNSHKEYPIANIANGNSEALPIGDFIGYAIARSSETNDTDTIEIHDQNNNLIGYFPKGNTDLHNKILQLGGAVEIKGHITKGHDNNLNKDIYFGHVSFVADI